nr:MAG TPA: hypothetical protein [Caudoviricetes sp.]
MCSRQSDSPMFSIPRKLKSRRKSSRASALR